MADVEGTIDEANRALVLRKPQIDSIYAESDGVYGSRKVRDELPRFQNDNTEILVGSNTNCSVSCPAIDPIHRGLRCEEAAGREEEHAVVRAGDEQLLDV